ncbi:MAG: hypothetical protein ACTSSI_16805 [Candidatus Helarchaeota archaeon]
MSNILNATPVNGEFNFQDWIIRNYLRRDGNNTVLFTWSNGSEVAANVTYLYVYNNTELVPTTPSPAEVEHISGNNYLIKELGDNEFNLTVYFNMSYWNSSTSDWEDNGVPIDSSSGATVTYECNFGPVQDQIGSFTDGFFGSGKWNGSFTAPSSDGDYYITVNASLGAPYEPFILNFTLTLTNLTTLVITPSADTIFWRENASFELNYTNSDTGSPVLNALITIQTQQGQFQENVNFTVNFTNSIYNVTIISATLHAQIYALNFSITTNETQVQRQVIMLTVQNRTTQFYANQTTYDVYLGDNLTIYLTYKDGINGTEIAWDSLTCLNNSGLVFTSFGGPGNYSTTINSSLMIEGTILNTTGVYQLVFRAVKQDYVTADLIITVNISALHSMLSFVITPEASISYDGTYVIRVVKDTTNHQIIVYYNDSWGYSGVGISDGSVNVTLNGSSLFASSAGTGNYTIQIDATVLSDPPAPSNYTLIIILSRPQYETKTLTAIVEIVEMDLSCSPLNSTEATFYPVAENWTFSMVLNRSLTFDVLCNDSNGNVTGASVSAYLNGSTCLVSEQGDGLYSIVVDSSTLINPVMTQNYTLLIIVDATGYKQTNVTIYLQLDPVPSILNPVDPELIGYGSETLNIDFILQDDESNIIKDIINNGYGEINFTIINSTYKTGVPVSGATGSFTWNTNGFYRASTLLQNFANGSYQVLVNFSGTPKNYFQNASHVSNLTILVTGEKITTQIQHVIPQTILESNKLVINASLEKLNGDPIVSENINFTVITTYLDSSTDIFSVSKVTNASGHAGFEYHVPDGASTISILMTYYGDQYRHAAANSSFVTVEHHDITLTIMEYPGIISPGETLSITVRLLNDTTPLVGKQVNLTITFAFTGGDSQEFLFSVQTDANGRATASIQLTGTLESAISVSINAVFYGSNGFSSAAAPKSIAILTQFEIFLRNMLPLLLTLLFIMITIIVIAVITMIVYVKYIRPKREPLAEKKRRLMIKRAETDKEIAEITRELNRLRQETLLKAKQARKGNKYEEAWKLYEKVGNLSLELAEKSVAKEFFAIAREMKSSYERTVQDKELRKERTRLINQAREAIKNQQTREAKILYSKIVEISRRLKDHEAVEKYSKLAGTAVEQVKTVASLDLRKTLKQTLAKADSLMGKQKFQKAAEHFEQASKILIALGEEDGVKRFIGWAKLAREREEMLTGAIDQWRTTVEEKQEKLLANADKQYSAGHIEDALEDLRSALVFAMELGDDETVENIKDKISKIETKIANFKGNDQEKNKMKLEKALKSAKEAEESKQYGVAIHLYESAASYAADLGDSEQAKALMEKVQEILEIKQKKEEDLIRKTLQENEKETPEETEQSTKTAEKKLPKPKQISETPIAKVKPIKIKAKKPTKPAKKAKKVKRIKKVIKIKKPGKTLAKEEAKLLEIRIENILKIASDFLNKKLYLTAAFLYRKAAGFSAELGDSEQQSELNLKAEHLETIRADKKIDQRKIRTKCRTLVNEAETAIAKKNIKQAIKAYEEVTENFFLLGDEDAALEFFEKIIKLREQVKNGKSEK